MRITESGMCISARELQEKASLQIIVVPFLIEYFPIDLLRHFNNSFPSMLYITPHSSSQPFSICSSVAIIENRKSHGFVII